MTNRTSPHHDSTPATRVKRAVRWAVALVVLGATVMTLPGALPPVALRAAHAVAAQQLQASDLWRDVPEQSLRGAPPTRRINGTRYRTVSLDIAALRNVLASAPREFTPQARNVAVILDLPWPDGGRRFFRIEDSPIMEEGLAQRFPELRTFSGQGIDDPSASVRFDWTPTGFHAMVLSGAGTVYVDPYAPGDVQHYISYFRQDYERNGATPFSCGVTEAEAARYYNRNRPGTYQPAHGTTLRTYRLAMAATGEYTAFFGGTVPNAMSAIVTSMNRVNGIYERDVAVRMTLIANNNLLVYTNGATDPYTNNNGFTMLGQNQTNVDAVIGTANYDIGHVFSTGGGGVAGLGVVCAAGNKARGVTGSPSPIGDPFDIDYVAHEIGHQYAGNHSFNGTTSACGGGNRNPATAYEIGSGSTIMAYAGICGAEDLQPNSDALFHAISQTEIINFITVGGGNACAVQTPTGNSVPTINAGLDYTIPQNTPFMLTAAGADANGDTLTYAWEEFDLGTASPPHTDDGSRPLFRPWVPTTTPWRIFPRLSNLLANTLPFGEVMPVTNRTMTFRVTVRDNRAGGGGTNSDDMLLTVNAASGPFVVTAPNTAVSWTGLTTQAVTWNVANTNAPPISTANVKISLSTDGGNSFPTVILASTPNDGTENITVPNLPTTTARIKVEAVGNVYFDISNVNFTITGGVPHTLTVTVGPGGAPNPVGSGGGVAASVTAVDSLGHALNYAWTASCPGLTNGLFGTPNAASSSWTAPVNTGLNRTCTMNVAINDGGFGLAVAPSYFQVVLGTLGAVPAPGDFDGDGKSDKSIYRPTGGSWFELLTTGGYTGLPFGLSTDIDVPADYDGDGKTDEAIWRPSSGTFYVFRSLDSSLGVFPWGASGDVPLAADVDGDKKADPIVWRPSPGVFYALLSGGGSAALSWGSGALGDIPLVGDWNGDGRADFGVWRPSSGTFYIAYALGGTFAINWGGGAFADQPIVGDWDGDRKSDFTVWRPGDGAWYILFAAGGYTALTWGGGAFGDIPLSGDFEGDGKTDIAVWRPSSGLWLTRLSSSGTHVFVPFGGSGDRPILRRQ